MVKACKLTRAELNRQDDVDNAIHQLLNDLAPEDHEVDWNMDYIGEIRDLIQDILVNREKIIGEKEFYPYRRFNGRDSFTPGRSGQAKD